MSGAKRDEDCQQSQTSCLPEGAFNGHAPRVSVLGAFSLRHAPFEGYNDV